LRLGLDVYLYSIRICIYKCSDFLGRNHVEHLKVLMLTIQADRVQPHHRLSGKKYREVEGRLKEKAGEVEGLLAQIARLEKAVESKSNALEVPAVVVGR
jgi:hypothetical protein